MRLSVVAVVVVCMYKKYVRYQQKEVTRSAGTRLANECRGEPEREAVPVVCRVGLGGAAQLSRQRRSSCLLSTTLSLLHLCTSASALVRAA